MAGKKPPVYRTNIAMPAEMTEETYRPYVHAVLEYHADAVLKDWQQTDREVFIEAEEKTFRLPSKPQSADALRNRVEEKAYCAAYAAKVKQMLGPELEELGRKVGLPTIPINVHGEKYETPAALAMKKKPSDKPGKVYPKEAMLVSLDPEIIDLLDKDELHAAIGHEVGHMQQPGVGRLGKGVDPGNEFDADLRGAELSGKPRALASAVIKIVLHAQQKAYTWLEEEEGLSPTSWRARAIVNGTRAVQGVLFGRHPNPVYRAHRLLKQEAEMFPENANPDEDYLKAAHQMYYQIRRQFPAVQAANAR